MHYIANRYIIDNLTYKVLTKREIEVLELRKKGLKQTDIASKLKISQPSVSAFENRALNKIHNAKEVLDLVKKLGVDYEK